MPQFEVMYAWCPYEPDLQKAPAVSVTVEAEGPVDAFERAFQQAEGRAFCWENCDCGPGDLACELDEADPYIACAAGYGSVDIVGKGCYQIRVVSDWYEDEWGEDEEEDGQGDEG